MLRYLTHLTCWVSEDVLDFESQIAGRLPTILRIFGEAPPQQFADLRRNVRWQSRKIWFALENGRQYV